MLQLLAYFDPSDFSFETLRRGLVGNSAPRWFRETFRSKAHFLSVVKILLGLSLIDHKAAEGSYSMHRVFHDWLCIFEANKPDLELLRLAISAISFSAPLVLTGNWADEQQQLGLHAIHILPRLENFDPVELLVRFDRFPSSELDLVASLIDNNEPRRVWEMLRFDHPVLGISKLLRSCGKTIEGYGLITRTQSMLERQEYHEDDFNRKAVTALLDMITMSYKMQDDGSELNSLYARFEALGSIGWAIKVRNIHALCLESNGKDDLAIQTWRDALATARLYCGSVFYHPAFMVFLNLAGRLQGSDAGAMLELLESAERDALQHINFREEAMWMYATLRRLRAGDQGPYIE